MAFKNLFELRNRLKTVSNLSGADRKILEELDQLFQEESKPNIDYSESYSRSLDEGFSAQISSAGGTCPKCGRLI